ncbi:hypothetical protein GJU39_10600 [Pedobacter petrophilus]|uniref:Uncharacterized protein n=1 Tax=Pedobacter petrophilus TaxID=1908241 RepID=A0A7K0FYL1_9SPHI|nr:hypothetical protein [Pedobacter petrophilus]MRX76541.1 hypothetical protein [Pedobacter petrophilus]
MAQKTIAGVYRQSTGNPEGGNTFFIFDDHKFVVAFFGGVIAGTWIIENDKVDFKPFAIEHQFYVYSRHNKDLADSSRIHFKHFDEAPTFLGFDQKEIEKPLLQSVFNPSPNCVDYPSVAKFKKVSDQLLFSDQPYHNDDSNLQIKRNVYTFENVEKYNDFIAYYRKGDIDKGPFSARVTDGKLFFGHSEKGSEKHTLPTEGEDFEFIKKFLEAPQTTEKVFCNPFYNQTTVDASDKDNWKFNESKNAFINFQNYVEGEENKPDEQDAYNKMNIVYQFDLLKLAEKKIIPFSINTKSLFIAICDQH